MTNLPRNLIHSYTDRIPAVRHRVLCASDLTPRSDRAVRRAAILARQMDADLMFVHVVEHQSSERIQRLKASRARVRLAAQVERAMAPVPERATIEIHLGKPLKVIAELAKQCSVDMIVLAAPTPRRFEKLVGTKAERIIRAAPCPVLFVSNEPAGAYAQIAVATDLSDTSVRAAQAVALMGIADVAYSWFVHAFEPPVDGMTVDEATAAERLETHKRQWSERVHAQLTPELEAAGFDLSRVRISAEPARPLDAIEHISEKVHPELLVIGTSRWFMLKRMLMSSVAHQVLTKMSCDILAMPTEAARQVERYALQRAPIGYAGARAASGSSPPRLNV
jgi:universal stress protein E